MRSQRGWSVNILNWGLLAVALLAPATAPASAARADAHFASVLIRADHQPDQPQEQADIESMRPRRVVRIVRTDAPPEIDGVIEPGEWDDAAVIDDFTQVDPDEGRAPTQPTEVRLLYDDDNLYVLFRAFDDEPEGVRIGELQRDVELDGSDRVSFVIDTFHDGRNGFFFETNPGGARRDALVEDQRNLRFDWDGIWNVRTSVDEQGWIAEFVIPFKTLSFDPEGATWGFNASRFIRRRNETIRWAAPRRDRELISLSEAGAIQGLTGLEQGIGLDVKPSLVLRNRTQGSRFRENLRFEPALDLFYKPSPFLTAALTINTDFAETEVDERRVNLTRFPLFFPEKRAFFLQDAGIFDFGGIRRSPLPFFSRRIGIGPDGRERDILAGLKLTGRYEGLNFGLLDVQMEDDVELGSKNLAVGRFAVNVLDESTVGAIFTYGDPNAPDDSGLVGADFNYRNSSDFGDAVVTGGFWLQQTFSSGESVVNDGSDETALGGRFEYESDVWQLSLTAEQIGADLNPALGFVRRRGIRQYFLRTRRRWRPEGLFKRFDLRGNANLVTDLSGDTETLEITAPELQWETRAGDRIQLSHQYQREVLTEPFEINDGVVIPTGDYDWSRFEASVRTSAGRPLAFSAEVRAGGFFTGDRLDTIFSLDWRPGPRLFASLEFERNDINLDEGDFITRIGRARLNISFSPDLTWSNFVQFDNVSDTLGINSRLQWIITPGSEIFFVVNQGFTVGDGRFDGLSTEIAAKVGWTFRF